MSFISLQFRRVGDLPLRLPGPGRRVDAGQRQLHALPRHLGPLRRQELAHLGVPPPGTDDAPVTNDVRKVFTIWTLSIFITCQSLTFTYLAS